MSTLRLTLRLPASPKAPGAARRALEGLELYIGDELCDTIKLLVSELVTNSVRHAALADQDVIEVSVTAAGETVRVEVLDPGHGFDPAGRRISLDDADERTSGWGLYLTDMLTHRWGVSRADQTRVWFEISPQRPVPRRRDDHDTDTGRTTHSSN